MSGLESQQSLVILAHPTTQEIQQHNELATHCSCVASYSDLLTLELVACNTNVQESLVKIVMYSDVPGCWMDVWRSGTFPEKQQ